MIYGSTLTMGIDYLMIVCRYSENEDWLSISTLILSEFLSKPVPFP